MTSSDHVVSGPMGDADAETERQSSEFDPHLFGHFFKLLLTAAGLIAHGHENLSLKWPQFGTVASICRSPVSCQVSQVSKQ